MNGESFLYLGRNYQLQIVQGQFKPLLLKQGKFCLEQGTIDDAKKHFSDFYRVKLKRLLKDKIPHYAAKIGVTPQTVKVMELKNRWGSCTADGAINIHWKCAMLPLKVLDYVVVHELAHLKYPNHTPAFWNAVEKILLNYEAEKNWLKFNGAGMSV